jgi:hypothetical protein
MASAGKQPGLYQSLSSLGAGGAAEVYVAENTRLTAESHCNVCMSISLSNQGRTAPLRARRPHWFIDSLNR